MSETKTSGLLTNEKKINNCTTMHGMLQNKLQTCSKRLVIKYGLYS